MSIIGSISTKQHYGLRLAIQLAKAYQANTPLSLGEIAMQERVSLKYLEQIIVPFKQAGWVKSVRGRSGGYLLVKNPVQLTVKDVVWVLSDSHFLVSCLADKKCPLDKKCMSKDIWGKVQKAIEQTLQKATLADLAK